MMCPGDPHQRNPNAPNFEDRSQEETEWQERCAREAAWKLRSAHAQPSQVVVVVPTDFGFDGRKDPDGILQEAVLQCFQERRRTVKVDLVMEDTLPQFRFRCHHTLNGYFDEVV